MQEKDGQLLYSGEEVSEPLEVLVVPAALANTQTFYVFQVETNRRRKKRSRRL